MDQSDTELVAKARDLLERLRGRAAFMEWVIADLEDPNCAFSFEARESLEEEVALAQEYLSCEPKPRMG